MGELSQPPSEADLAPLDLSVRLTQSPNHLSPHYGALFTHPSPPRSPNMRSYNNSPSPRVLSEVDDNIDILLEDLNSASGTHFKIEVSKEQAPYRSQTIIRGPRPSSFQETSLPRDPDFPLIDEDIDPISPNLHSPLTRTSISAWDLSQTAHSRPRRSIDPDRYDRMLLNSPITEEPGEDVFIDEPHSQRRPSQQSIHVPIPDGVVITDEQCLLPANFEVHKFLASVIPDPDEQGNDYDNLPEPGPKHASITDLLTVQLPHDRYARRPSAVEDRRRLDLGASPFLKKAQSSQSISSIGINHTRANSSPEPKRRPWTDPQIDKPSQAYLSRRRGTDVGFITQESRTTSTSQLDLSSSEKHKKSSWKIKNLKPLWHLTSFLDPRYYQEEENQQHRESREFYGIMPAHIGSLHNLVRQGTFRSPSGRKHSRTGIFSRFIRLI